MSWIADSATARANDRVAIVGPEDQLDGGIARNAVRTKPAKHAAHTAPRSPTTAGCRNVAVAMNPPPIPIRMYTAAATHTPQLGETTPDRTESASSSPPKRDPGPVLNQRVIEVDSSKTPASTQPAGITTVCHRDPFISAPDGGG